jgi:hypothetical protein
MVKKHEIPTQFLGFLIIEEATFIPREDYLEVSAAPEFRKY